MTERLKPHRKQTSNQTNRSTFKKTGTNIYKRLERGRKEPPGITGEKFTQMSERAQKKQALQQCSRVLLERALPEEASIHTAKMRVIKKELKDTHKKDG